MADTQASRQRRFLQDASEAVGGGTNRNRKRRGKRKSKSPSTRKAGQEEDTPTHNDDADEAKNAKTEELDELLQFPAAVDLPAREFPSPPSGGEKQSADDSGDPHSPPPSGWETEAGAKKLTSEV